MSVPGTRSGRNTDRSVEKTDRPAEKAIRSVIVADNNEFYRRVLGDFFREQGFDVRTARDGMQALQQLEQSPPDLLVLDLIMPSIDGAQLCSWVKSRQEHRHIPVVIVSGILTDEIDDLASIGAEAYVAKMPMEQIAEALKEAIRLLLYGERRDEPILFGFEKMYRREVVLELIQDRRARAETLDSLTEGIVELSRERRVLRTNRAFEAIAGRSSCEVLSRPLEEIFPEGGNAFDMLFAATDAETRTAAVFAHRGRHLQAKIHRVAHEEPTHAKTGELLDTVARQNAKVLLHSMLESIGFTLMVEDITDRVQAEQERETLKARLAQSEKMSALGVFVSGAAHELNNPLTSILGYSQLVMKKSGENGSEMKKIVEGAQQCKLIVEQLMAFARSLRPDRKVTDLNAVLRDVLSARADGIAAQGIRVEEDLAAVAPSLVDAAQIGQVFHHLLDNAINALGEARGVRKLRVASRLQEDQVIIEVADSGPGIPEDRLDRVFDPFFTMSNVGIGRGLGLSVAYGIVTAHGGRISANNSKEGGAVIRLELTASQEQPEQVVARPQPRVDAQPRRILVVDDEKVVAELIVEILSDPNHQIDSAHNGLDALKQLRQRNYDLIVLDLRMPDMSGQQMYEQMERHHPEHIPRVLFVTGDTVMPEIQEFLRRAGNPCLLKPFAVEDVIRKAHEILYAPSRVQEAAKGI